MQVSKAESAATETAEGVRKGPFLLGIFGPQNDLNALVRMPGGFVKKIKPGARLRGAIVAAIDSDGIILQRNGTTSRMGLVAN